MFHKLVCMSEDEGLTVFCCSGRQGFFLSFSLSSMQLTTHICWLVVALVFFSYSSGSAEKKMGRKTALGSGFWG